MTLEEFIKEFLPNFDDFDWIGNHHYERINWEE